MDSDTSLNSSSRNSYTSLGSSSSGCATWKMKTRGSQDFSCHLASSCSQFSEVTRYRQKILLNAYREPLDRVNELGDDRGYGHTGFALCRS